MGKNHWPQCSSCLVPHGLVDFLLRHPGLGEAEHSSYFVYLLHHSSGPRACQQQLCKAVLPVAQLFYKPNYEAIYVQ